MHHNRPYCFLMAYLGRPLRWAVTVLMLAPAVASAALVPDASDNRTSAQALRGSFSAAIDRPGDHDWYSVRGSDIRTPIREIVDISVLRTEPGCTSPQPLLLVLRTAEGRWIHAYPVSTSRTDVEVPSFPGHHYIEIYAADGECTLLYGLTIISQSLRRVNALRTRAQVPPVPVLCRSNSIDIFRLRRQIRQLGRRRHSLKSSAARRRYTRSLKRERTKLAAARARRVNLACDQFH